MSSACASRGRRCIKTELFRTDYVAMRVAAIAAGKKSPSAADIAAIDPTRITDEVISKSIDSIKKAYEGLGGGDRVAKGSELVDQVKNEIATIESV